MFWNFQVLCVYVPSKCAHSCFDMLCLYMRASQCQVLRCFETFSKFHSPFYIHSQKETLVEVYRYLKKLKLLYFIFMFHRLKLLGLPLYVPSDHIVVQVCKSFIPCNMFIWIVDMIPLHYSLFKVLLTSQGGTPIHNNKVFRKSYVRKKLIITHQNLMLSLMLNPKWNLMWHLVVGKW